jgi:hypothetical protein
MAKITEAAILKRAKELCEKNSTAWDKTNVRLRTSKYDKIFGALDEVGRNHYLALAKEKLLKEQAE